MTDRITISAMASTPDGLSSVISEYVDVDVVEKIEVTAAKNSAPMVVAVHPLTVPVQFICITAEAYTNLAFAVGQGAPVTMDKPLMLMGEGLVALLGIETAEITFINSDTEDDNNITILVGRDAVAPQGE